MFELVVVILVVSIIFAYAFSRFRGYPEAAERAAFLAVTAQLKSGLNLQMMRGIAADDRAALERLQGSNPMGLVLEAPVNYLGAFTAVDDSGLPRRAWYFDSSAGELVYLVDNNTEVYEFRDGRPQPTDQIRMRIRVVYGNDPSGPQSIYRRSFATMPVQEGGGVGSTRGEAPDERGDWAGLQLQAARMYTWGDTALGAQGAVHAGPG